MSTLRQHLFASGCIVKDKPDDATCVVEVRAGALGTNRNDLLWGIPATNLPSGGAMLPLAPTSLPELSLMKKTAQQGVCKVAVFAYDRASGQPIWQSGVRQQVSKAKDVWVFGTGPFQHGTIYEGTKFAGEHLQVPLAGKSNAGSQDKVWVAHEMRFREPPRVARLPAATSAPGSTSADAPAATPPAAPANSAEPAGSASAAGPPPSVITTSSYGGMSQPAAASSTSPGAAQASPTPNAASGAYGAVQAVDWARTVRENYSTAR
jgi:hypothetical protein